MKLPRELSGTAACPRRQYATPSSVDVMAAELKPYPAYKDSGVSWLGDVPANWTVQRIKTLFREREERTRDGTGLLLSLTRARGLLPQSEASNRLASADDLSKYRICTPGDLVMNRMQASSGMFAVSRHEGLVSPDYSVFEATEPCETKYFEHVFKAPQLVDQFAQASKGIGTGFNRLYTPDFGAVPIVFPPLSEQAAIVRFLDHADRRIRHYIRAKERLITLLEEQRQAIIRQAVTGKIDVRTGEPYSAYRSFGAEWMGEVPERWNVIRLKLIATKIVDCLHATPNYSEDGEFPAVRTADISPGEVHVSSARRVNAAEYVRWTARLEPKRGDILYSREGERFGIAACVPDGVRLCISQRMMVFRIRAEHNSTFVMWVLNSNPVLAQARQYIMGATAPHVNVSTIRNYCLALPGRDEQDRLVDTIENRTKGQGAAIAAARQSIACLGEYRTRLISDVVSGKVDVRAAAARLEETDPLARRSDNDREPGAGAESSPHEPLGTIDEARA